MKTFRDINENEDVVLSISGQIFHTPLRCKQEHNEVAEMYVRIPYFNSFWFVTDLDATSVENNLTSLKATLYTCEDAIIKPKKRKKTDGKTDETEITTNTETSDEGTAE